MLKTSLKTGAERAKEACTPRFCHCDVDNIDDDDADDCEVDYDDS